MEDSDEEEGSLVITLGTRSPSPAETILYESPESPEYEPSSPSYSPVGEHVRVQTPFYTEREMALKKLDAVPMPDVYEAPTCCVCWDEQV